MDEIMDQLNQVIEERVLELKRKSEEDKVPAYCTETKEHVLRMDRILNSLSEDDRQWLDDQLMAKMDIPEQERLRYYKAGLADAIELIHYLRTDETRSGGCVSSRLICFLKEKGDLK